MLDALLLVATTGASAAGALLLWALRTARPPRREDHPQEWIYTALAFGRRDLVTKGDPDINWNEVHPHFGMPLHAIGGKGIRLEVEGAPYASWTEESNACIKDLLALFEFAMRRGADPSAACPLSCRGGVRFRVSGDAVGVYYDLWEPVGGRSAISLWLAFSQRAKEVESEKTIDLPLASVFFDGILSLLLHEIPKHKGLVPRRPSSRLEPLALVEVPEATAGLWQRVLAKDEACDVVFQCPDGEVRVHSAVVGSTSRVLAAMLAWPRGEQGPWKVRVEERKEVLEAWRLLVYTGLPPAEGLSTDILLELLSLSHRWQDHLVECGLLTTALSRRVVDGESCARVLEAAVSKDLVELRCECLAFARRSREVRRDWERGHFTGEVQSQLGSVLEVRRRSGGGACAAGARRWEL